MIRVAVCLAGLLALVCGGFYLDHRALTALLDESRAKVSGLTESLQLSEQRAEQARVDYQRLDAAFEDLQKAKQQVRVVTQTHKVYIKEAAQRDASVGSYLAEPLPTAVECVLTESCDRNQNGIR
ncbi:hypothetical protein G8770_03630 [Aestuariicella hydrocarbonica]|uniref:Uncharacterized protein n=1 Tax=Pseudomaricurvus hydrocarbonicus TaxID=1470433 RepID=A0A9E5JSJ7_9GAMM|nr:hypothetical protein [Aestuariicella hydrocarbonica]NHO64636.1 hypothetical protein [Aestuariicella hydrocarbonica]